MIMNRRILCTVFLLVAGQHALAEDVYGWVDETGTTHFANTPTGAQATLVYSTADAGKVFQWSDESGQVHFSDVPPAGTAKPREILIEPLAEPVGDPDEYSIVRQAARMAEDRRRVEEARLLREQTRFERSRLARDMAVLRMQEQIRTRGYGPRPDPYAYSYSYGYVPGW
jgi:hypothetical protein